MAADPVATFGAVGAQVEKQNDEIVIMHIIPGSSAEKAAIPVGTRIVSVDGKVVKGMAVEEVVKLIRGAAGTNVSIVAIPPASPVSKTYVLPRVAMLRASIDSIPGTYSISEEPGATVIIEKVDQTRLKITWPQQHRSGIGLISQAKQNVKGVYQLEDHPDVIESLRTACGFFQIDPDINTLKLSTRFNFGDQPNGPPISKVVTRTLRKQ